MTIKVGDTVPLGKFATVPYTPELESGLACGARECLSIYAHRRSH